MRTSSTSSQRHRPSHLAPKKKPRWAGLRLAVGAVVLVALLAAADYVLALCLQPYGTITEVTWWTYRQTGDDLDTVFVGNSRMDASIDPAAFDKAIGSKSVSLSTVFQALEDSGSAAATAASEHKLKRIVLGISPSSLCEGRHIQSSSTFTQAKAAGEPLPQAIADYAALLTSKQFFFVDKSVSALFPWTYSHVPYQRSAIITNLRNRRYYSSPIDGNWNSVVKDFWKVNALGDRYVDAVADFTTVSNSLRDTRDEDHSFLEDRKQAFVDCLDACDDYDDVQLYVVALPLPFFELINHSRYYPEQMQWIKEQTEAHGGVYIDFNLAHGDYYPPVEGEYADQDHHNPAGSKRFSETLAQTIARIESGEDVRGDFYSYEEWDDLLASYDWIYLVGFDVTGKDDGLLATIWSFEGSQVDVEYEVSVLDPKTGEYEVVSPYGPTKERWWPMEGDGVCTIRVRARRVGSHGAAEQESTRQDVPY